MRGRIALGLVVIAMLSCRRTDVVGSLLCRVSSDCLPPATICSPDGRCVTGCSGNPTLCISGQTCSASTGECYGGATKSCNGDSDCDPPDLVCGTAGVCSPGCTLTLNCSSGTVCNPTTGHCCTPGSPGCPNSMPPPPPSCNSDAECPNAPANICSGGMCIPGCAHGGSCSAPLACDPTTGHCATPKCARDLDCDAGSYCTQAGNCVVLAFGGAMPCAGGATVTAQCAQVPTAMQFVSCAGAPGPVGCPYCIDGSCMHPGLCVSDNDCHGGDACVSGLCSVIAPQCPSLVQLGDIVKGMYAAGKEVCIRGPVTSVHQGYDGETELRIGNTPFLYVDLEPMYGLKVPSVGQTITVHGTVRWDAGHQDRELLPVDWYGM
jgi:hypothetical protein